MRAVSSLRLPAVGVLGIGLALGGCNMDIEAPDRVMDADLDVPQAVVALTAGAVADYAEAYVVPGGGGTVIAGAMLTDELVHSGTWIGLRGPSDGESQDDWVEAQSRWAEPSQARWTAETGVERVTAILNEEGLDPASSEYVAALALHAGMSNVMLGDNFCQAVINGGGYEPRTVFYTRSLPYFDQAMSVGAAAGDGVMTGEWDDGDDIAMAARVGKARALMQLGDWSAAVSAASGVPTDFVYEILYDDASGIDNDVRWWGYLRDETTVWGTPFQFWGDNVDNPTDDGDPRVPYNVKLVGADTAESGDGRRPFFRQLKYPTYDADIGGMKGTQARLIEAEAALVQQGAGAIGTVEAKINEVRGLYPGVSALDAGGIASEADAWQALMKERGLELWLEGKRLGDWRRWALNEPGVNSPAWEAFRVVRDENTGAPASTDAWQAPILDTEVWAEMGDICFQVSKDEKDSNPNI